MQGFEPWLKQYHNELIPFKDLLRDLGLSENLIIRMLYRFGFRGRRVMLLHPQDEKRTATEGQEENTTAEEEETSSKDMLDFLDNPQTLAERNILMWQQELAANHIACNMPVMLRRWPKLFLYEPNKEQFQGTIEVLKSLVGGDLDKVQSLIMDEPIVSACLCCSNDKSPL